MGLAPWIIAGGGIGVVLHLLIGRFFAPENFGASWYGWITNQTGHALVMFLALSVAIVALIGTGTEVPYRAELAAQGVSFALAFQAMQWRAGGKFFDCLEDAVFMGGHGWIAPVYSFKVGADNIPDLVPQNAAIALTLIVFHLAIGSALRFDYTRRGN